MTNLRGENLCSRRSHRRPLPRAMAAYDKLDPVVRAALQEATANFCPLCARDLAKRYGPVLAARIISEQPRDAG